MGGIHREGSNRTLEKGDKITRPLIVWAVEARDNITFLCVRCSRDHVPPFVPVSATGSVGSVAVPFVFALPVVDLSLPGFVARAASSAKWG